EDNRSIDSIGAIGNDVGPSINIARVVQSNSFDAVLVSHFPCVRFPAVLDGTVNLNPLDISDCSDRFDMRSRHAARSKHSDHAGIFPGHILYSQRRVRAHPRLLQISVVEQSQRLAIVHAEKKDQAAEGPMLHAILLLSAYTLMLAYIPHVGHHAYR